MILIFGLNPPNQIEKVIDVEASEETEKEDSNKDDSSQSSDNS